jgi:hypothetical protein
MVSEANRKALIKALDKAADMAISHGDAVQEAERAFEKAFRQDLPEECFSISGGDSKNEAASLFNNFAVHGENMSGEPGVEGLVRKMEDLMRRKD